MMECNLCFGEFRDGAERCPWCLNPVENDAELVGEDWKDRSAVVRAESPPLLDGGVFAFLEGRGQRPVYIAYEEEAQAVHLTPLEAHRLARWITANVPLDEEAEAAFGRGES